MNNNNNKIFDLVYILNKLKKKYNLLLNNDNNNNIHFCNYLNNEICGFEKCENISFYLKNNIYYCWKHI
jgi:hypothetical protein